MPLIVLRIVFLLVAAGGAVTLVQSTSAPKEPVWLPWAIFGGIMLVATAVVTFDWLLPRKRLDIISSVYFGLIVGLFLTYVARLALAPAMPLNDFTRGCIELVVALFLCYTCISFLMQTRTDFRFIIPYVEFSKEVKGLKPYVLDTSVVIDGRIADVVETNVLDSQLLMPRFVLGELQAIADSSDRLRRSRGRRGLDILNRLRSNPTVDLQIFDRTLPEFEGQPVDLKLVLLA
ncbi:MAG: PIN/TRAM domain-containing protein, partial [Pirellulales bacterium]